MTVLSQFGRNSTGVPQLLMCGICNKPATLHRNHEELDAKDIRDFCDRGYESIFTPSEHLDDYYLHSRCNGTEGVVPFRFFEGAEANVVSLLEPSTFDYDGSWETELESLDRWSDNDPTEQTYAMGPEWLFKNGESFYRETTEPVIGNGHLPSNYTPMKRNVFIEGQEGFFSSEVYDPELTTKYTLRLLNVFTNKRGTMQCGGVEIIHNIDGTITAKCVNDYCPSTQFTVDPETMNTELLEGRTYTKAQADFVLTVIRHGNNHAASWFRNRIATFARKTGQDSSEVIHHTIKDTSIEVVTSTQKSPTFYKIHSENCDLTCDPHVHYCQSNAVPVITSADTDWLRKRTEDLREWANSH